VEKKKPLYVNTEALLLLAPQPGLEPGTYGLTEKVAAQKSIFKAHLNRFIFYV
jgi:hypothetical protein